MDYLCVFDMDETLLSPDKTISSRNEEALAKLREAGIGITIATGRSPLMIGKYADMLSLSLPVVACNGGALVKPENAEVIWECPIEDTILRNLLSYLIDQKTDFLIYSSKKTYYATGSRRVQIFHTYNSTVPPHQQVPLQEFTMDDMNRSLPDVIKVLVYLPTAEQEAYLRGITELETVNSGEGVFDIMQNGSTKGNGIRSLSEYLQIPLQNIVVFGDSENDISMFTCGAVGVAMGNSLDEIKMYARYVTGSNFESGVAQAVYDFVLPHFGIKA